MLISTHRNRGRDDEHFLGHHRSHVAPGRPREPGRRPAGRPPTRRCSCSATTSTLAHWQPGDHVIVASNPGLIGRVMYDLPVPANVARDARTRRCRHQVARVRAARARGEALRTPRRRQRRRRSSLRAPRRHATAVSTSRSSRDPTAARPGCTASRAPSSPRAPPMSSWPRDGDAHSQASTQAVSVLRIG